MSPSTQSSWPDHISSVVNKANLTLGFLRQNLMHCPPTVKINYYNSLIIPILEYACTSWTPRFQKDINNIKMVQCRAARFVFNSYTYNTSVSTLLDALNWPTLQQRRNNLKAIMMYKIINNLIRIPANQFLTPALSSTHNHHHHYKIPYSRIIAHLFSFFPMSIRIWNNLKPTTACSPSLKVF